MAGISCLSRPRQVTIHLLLFFRSFRVIMNETSVSLTVRSSSGFTIDPIGRAWPLFPLRRHPSNNVAPLVRSIEYFCQGGVNRLCDVKGETRCKNARFSLDFEDSTEPIGANKRIARWLIQETCTYYYIMILLFSCQKIIGRYKYQTAITESFRFI